VTGTIASPAQLTVSSGANLIGTGTIVGPVSVLSGGHLAPGLSPGTINTGSLLLKTGSFLDEQIFGSTPGTGAGHYDQVNVTGTVNLDAGNDGGATLTLDLTGYTPTTNTVHTIIANDGTDAVVGKFKYLGNVLNNGDSITIGSVTLKIFYTGGDGNDVVLIEAGTPNAVYISNTNFGGATPPSPGQLVDGDQGTAGTQTAYYLVNAFNTVATGLATIPSTGTVIVNGGTYGETLSLSGTRTLRITGLVTLNSLDSILGNDRQYPGQYPGRA